MKSLQVVAAIIIKHEMLKQVQHDGCVIQHDTLSVQHDAPSAQHDWQAAWHNDSSRQDDNRHSESTTVCHFELDSESVCKVFVTQRGYDEWRGFWEFPGGKIESGYPDLSSFQAELCLSGAFGKTGTFRT